MRKYLLLICISFPWALTAAPIGNIQLRDSIQSGATFYVSSATVSGQTTVGTFRVGSGAVATGRSEKVIVDSGDIAIGQNTTTPDRRIYWYGFAGNTAGSLGYSATVPTGVQFYDSGGQRIGGSMDNDITGTSKRGMVIRSSGSLRFYDGDNSNFVSLRSSDTVGANVEWVLPSSDGTIGQALTTDGSKNLRFTTISGGSGTSPLDAFYLYNGAAYWKVSVDSSGSLVTTTVGSVPSGALLRTNVVVRDSGGSYWSITVNSSGDLITTASGSYAADVGKLSLNDSLGFSWVVTVDTSGNLTTT